MQDSSCGRFLVAGWPLPAAAEVQPGSIDRQGAVPSVASTPIRLNSNAYYLLVRACAGAGASGDLLLLLLLLLWLLLLLLLVLLLLLLLLLLSCWCQVVRQQQRPHQRQLLLPYCQPAGRRSLSF